MSLYGAMMTGVAGLSAYSNSLSVTSANIANVNTVGYKNATSNFNTLLASASSTNNSGSATVVSSSGQAVSEQGLLQPSSSTTDLAISGNGFFVVSSATDDSAARAYTRAGNFSPDDTGFLKNSAGMYLLGWQLDANGNVPSDRNNMTAINASSLTGKAEASTTASAQINLQKTTAVNAGAATYSVTGATPSSVASGAIKADFQRTINVYDSQGGQQPLQLSFVKTGANTWQYEVTYQGKASDLNAASALVGATPSLVQYGTVTFNSDGSLAGITSHDTTGALVTATTANPTFNINIPWSPATSGLQPQNISMNFGALGSATNLTQFDNASNMASSKVNGALFGSLTGVTIDKDGVITAQFSNGLSQKVYKIPLATFANPNGMTQISGNAFTTSVTSGSPTINEANLGGAGKIESKNLEQSTVDLATQFTDLITTQRAYSAASKIVTTASTMLDNLLQMGR
ncbi:flagellar hook protein FlgE [Rhizomicrobium palustre]|jgi:flagellar hook protein FlgE|uniref:Flagellar hook protein FlgE n=1 Tax=Rhizomicrobium palustre TaxID=189966 RepID=A0A846MX30_9PROT|nr:flagellar hook protein FlgE [Rhizomicrobium palustre]NIK87799.1 flagellar hook protein FlgE [Rhizomicrobium palustre]